MMGFTAMVLIPAVVEAVLSTQVTPVREDQNVMIFVRRIRKPVTILRAPPAPTTAMPVPMMNVMVPGSVYISIIMPLAMMGFTAMVMTPAVVEAALSTQVTPVRGDQNVMIFVKRLRRPVTHLQAPPVPMTGMYVRMTPVTVRGPVCIQITAHPVMTGCSVQLMINVQAGYV